MQRPTHTQDSSSLLQGRDAGTVPDQAVEEPEELSQPLEPPGAKVLPRPSARKDGLSILTAEELREWDALVEASPQCSLFCKSWWLKAACGEVRVLGLFAAGRLAAGIPLYYESRMGIRLCRMPMLTQTMGVVIEPIKGKAVNVNGREKEILDIFAERLGLEPVFIQAFHPTSQNWLPFYWRGFTQTTHYTYVLDDLESLDRIWDGLTPTRRTNIRKARKLGITVRECGPDLVFNAWNLVLERQGRKSPYSFEYLRRLFEAAQKMGAGTCLAAEDPFGTTHAACFFVWDSKRGYLIAGGHDPALSESGASSLMLWHLIEFAATRTAVFDFEGSMTKQVERAFRHFGAKRVGYNRIVKMPRWLRICLLVAGKMQV
jgi:hypothetical protein